ncbi:unnamed protein product, partial [Didymodactylos carnosus]
TCLQEFQLHHASTMNYEELESFLKQLKILKRLSLNFECRYNLIDGERLVQGFLFEMRELDKLNFCIESRERLLPVAPDYAATFQGLYWLERGWNVHLSHKRALYIWLATLVTYDDRKG